VIRRLAPLLVLMTVGGALACRRGPDGSVASLFEARGTVDRSNDKAWRSTKVGDRFAIGDAIRTGAGSSARLRMDGGSVIALGENGRLRIQRGTLPGTGASEVSVESGNAEIEQSEGTGFAVVTAAGRTRIEGGAHVRVRAHDEDVTLEVLLGRAVLIGPEGDLAVEAGHGVRLRIGGAVIEKIDLKVGRAVVEPLLPTEPPAPAAAVEPAPAEAAPPAEAEPAAVAGTTRSTRSEQHGADVTIPAGESAVLHDARSSLRVRLRFDHLCPGEGTVETGSRRHSRERLSAVGAVAFKLRTGKQPYRLRCKGDPDGGKPRAAGVLSLRRDNGEVPLPRRAGANVIDADGRRYTILFQSRPPALTLVWPAAPSGAKDLELHVQSPAGTRTLPTKAASHKLASGSLDEGTHSWWYATKDGLESPHTTVALRFDNTAPTAQFFKAASATDKPGAVPVDGVTVPGATVSAAGKPLDVDENGRFRAAVAPLDGDSAVAVRLEPARGRVHYYVRRRQETR
jgi:hypothetical protein